MTRLRVRGAQQLHHRRAELAMTTSRQTLPAENPTIKPERLREIAAARRRLAAQQARHLLRRGDVDDQAARWARQSIRNLLAEEAALLRQADELEAAHAGA
jgi:hypothetical protein